MAKLFLVLFIWIAGFSSTACTPFAFPSDLRRANSFAPLARATVGAQSLDLYLRQRTAVLVGECPGGEMHISEAVAVDPRGYFVTAAHCLEATQFHLFYFDGFHTRVATPRVVAVEADKVHDDFALIHVAGTTRCVFQWAEPGLPGEADVAVAVGGGPDDPNSKSTLIPPPQCLAGRIVSLEPSGRIALRILHNLPLRPGDSGGPLATTNGKLIGINTGVRVSWLGEAVAMAIRPDPRWVRYRIDQDAAAVQIRETISPASWTGSLQAR